MGAGPLDCPAWRLRFASNGFELERACAFRINAGSNADATAIKDFMLRIDVAAIFFDAMLVNGSGLQSLSMGLRILAALVWIGR